MATRSRQRSWTVPQTDPPLSTPIYLVDGDCGFCTRAMARVLRAFPNTFQAIPYREADLAGLGLTLEQCGALGHFAKPVDGGIRISSGSQSWAGILKEQGPGWRAIGALMRHAPGKWVADGVYSWVARNRGRLGWLVP